MLLLFRLSQFLILLEPLSDMCHPVNLRDCCYHTTSRGVGVTLKSQVPDKGEVPDIDQQHCAQMIYVVIIVSRPYSIFGCPVSSILVATRILMFYFWSTVNNNSNYTSETIKSTYIYIFETIVNHQHYFLDYPSINLCLLNIAVPPGGVTEKDWSYFSYKQMQLMRMTFESWAVLFGDAQTPHWPLSALISHTWGQQKRAHAWAEQNSTT